MRLDTVIPNAGATQFNIYLMSGDEEQTLDVYRHKIFPYYRH